MALRVSKRARRDMHQDEVYELRNGHAPVRVLRFARKFKSGLPRGGWAAFPGKDIGYRSLNRCRCEIGGIRIWS